MVSNTATNFENSKHRRIYQGGRGGFFVRRQKPFGGELKIYNPVAKFRINADGHSSKLTNENRNKVPNSIRPAARKIRKNKGVKRVGGLGAMVNRHPNNVPNMIVNLNNLVAPRRANNNRMMVPRNGYNLPPRRKNNNNNRGMGGLVAVGPNPNNLMAPRPRRANNNNNRGMGGLVAVGPKPNNLMAPRN